jgi:alkylation response protein AidB-like acyl-CoA dehydrogenase
MDFSVIDLDDDAAAFADDVRRWLDEHVTDELIDAEWTLGDGHDVSFHRALGARGWAFPTLPVDEGGAGLDELHARILATEVARHQVPSTMRNVTSMIMPAVRQWMVGPQRDEILRRAAAGEVAFCLGYTEPDAGSDLASVRTRAVADGDQWVIDGQKMFTTGAHLCQYCFLLARTDPDVPKHKGLTMFLVPLDTPGIEIQGVPTLGGERTNMVFYDGVRISDDYRLGPVGHGWIVLHGPLNEEHRMGESGPRPVEEEPGEAEGGASADMAAYILRVHEPAVRAAVQWARTPGYDGRRPIDNPRVRERLADIELGVAVSKLTPGPHGRVFAADTLIRASRELVDLVGPAALIPHGHPSAIGDGWIEYAHRFAQACAIYGGTTEVIRNLIAERFLNLGRSRKTNG